MGTNYYAEINSCPMCKRGERVHIGKSSAGWTFSFHATDDIRSWADWQRVLYTPTTKIVDEYGREHSSQAFTDMVESKKDAPNNHAAKVLNKDKDMFPFDIVDDRYLEGHFLDSEGHSFSEGEFS